MITKSTAPLDNLGPILATAFDKAVGQCLSKWQVFAAAAVIAIGVGYFNAAFSMVPLIIFVIYWAFAALANAIRLYEPDYKMTAGNLLVLLLLQTVIGALVAAGVLCLVIPGIWLSTKLSLAPFVYLSEKTDAGDAAARAWTLTTGRFWETFLFEAVVGVAVSIAAFAGEIFVIILLGVLGSSLHIDEANSAPMGVPGLVLGFGIVVYFAAIVYATQAQLNCLRLWLDVLVTGQPKVPAPAYDPSSLAAH